MLEIGGENQQLVPRTVLGKRRDSPGTVHVEKKWKKSELWKSIAVEFTKMERECHGAFIWAIAHCLRELFL
jgi:hypothetical protein